MKKNLLMAAVVAAMAISSFGQGVVTFNAGGGKLKYTTDGTTIISAPQGSPPGVGADTIGTYGKYNTALYAATVGTALSGGASTPPTLSGSWAIMGTPSSTITAMGPGAGNSPSVSVTLPGSAGAAGVDVQLEIVGWTGTDTTFAQAVTDSQAGLCLVGWVGSTLSGGAFSWDNPTGTGTSPAALVVGSSGFNSLVLQSLAPVPEPTTLALGGLGAAALLLFRRRK